MVELSWMANPCERSSRSMMLRVPPDLGVCPRTGAASTSVATMRLRTIEIGKARERVIRCLLEIQRVGVYVKTRGATNRFPGAHRISKEANRQVNRVQEPTRQP